MVEEQIKELAEYVLEKYQETNSLYSYFSGPSYYGVTEFRKFLKRLGLLDMAKLNKEDLKKISDKADELAHEIEKNNFLSTINEKILDWIVLCNKNCWRYNLTKDKTSGCFYFSIVSDYGDVDGGIDYVYFSESVTYEIERRLEIIRQQEEEVSKKLAALNKLTDEEKKLLGLK